MKKVYLLALSSFSLLVSCSEDINLDIAKGDPKIVIEGNIENGKYAEVMITRNSALSDPVNFSNILVTNARAWITHAGVTDTLRINIDTTAAIPVLYKGNTIIGAVGETYYLTVQADGKTYTSITTIPQLIKLDSVWWKAQAPETDLGYAWAHLSDPAGLGNDYKWFAKRPTGSVILNGKRIIINRRFVSPFGGTTDDSFFDGKSFDFNYGRAYDATQATYDDLEPKKERGYYKKTDTIYIKFCTIDAAVSKFYTSYDQAVQNNGNPFAAPASIFSNIQGDGALGVWAGFGATFDTIMPHP